MPKNN